MNHNTPIAKNNTQLTKSLFNEGMHAIESKTSKKTILRVVLVLGIIYLLVIAWLLHTGGSLFLLLGQSIFLAAVLFWLIVMLPASKRRAKYKAMAQGNDIAPRRELAFYQDQVTITADSGKVTNIPYSDVIGWKETDNLYILSCTNKHFLLIDKKGFAFGDFDAVKAALPID